MAQRPGRSGHTRRERNRALYAQVIGVGVVLAGLVLLVVSRVDPGRGGGLRTAALEATAPVWEVLRVPAAWVSGLVADIDDYFGAVSRNRRLEVEARRAELVRQDRDRLAHENSQLKRLLRVVEPVRGWSRVLPIAGASAGSYVRSAVIGGGSGAGVASGMPVRAIDGLVGQIVETGPTAARVLLLTDASSRVPVRVERTGRPAMVAGVNGALLEVRYGSPGDTPLMAGDRLVTSGDGGIFPPGIPVAEVVDAAGDPPRARPIARPDGIGYVVVERPYLPPVATAPAVPPVNTPWRLMTRDERLQWTLGHWRALVPALSTALAIAMMTVPVMIPLPALPHLGFLAVACWALFQGELMPTWVAFLLGLLADAVLALPFGVNATLLPLLSASIGAITRRFGPWPFFADWLLVALLTLPYAVLEWRLLSFVGAGLPFTPLLVQAATTALAYPIVAAVCTWLQRGWR